MAQWSSEWKVPCPIQLVWDVATDLSHTAWRSDLRKVEVLGPGQYVETSQDGGVSHITVSASEPCQRLLLQVEGQGTYGTRELRFEGDEMETKIIIRDEMMGRTLLISLSESAYIKKFQKRYLRDLNNELYRIVRGED